MPKYRINLVTVASTSVDVEAADSEAALEAVFEGDLPYAPAFADYEFGEWSLASELFPDSSSTEDDVIEMSA